MPVSLPCDACSFRRVKCDGKNPCSTCLCREQSCTYLKVRKRRGPKGPRRSTNVRVQAMQKNLGIEKSCSMRECSLQAPDESPASPEPSNSPQPARRRIPLATYCTYIDIFRSRLYNVWPIVSTNALKARLSDTENIESYTLAAALCAATLAQLRLPGHTEANGLSVVASDDFVRECLRFRADFDYRSSAGLESLLTSLFLHMYYANMDQIALATFALRDAITHAHLLSLGGGQRLESSQTEEYQLRLRVYWILLVTERTFCMQHDLPITLQTIEDLPVPVDDGDSDPALLTGFCNLVQLFTRIDGPLIQAPYLSSPSPTYPRARVADIQESLQAGATRNPIIDEVQRVDIWITLAWLSSLLWQYSASHFMLMTESADICFSPSYPLVIARNFLSLVSGASIDSVRPHGYGMEIKLFQLANSLIDVLVYVPSVVQTYDSSDWGPRHAVVALEHLLDLVAGGQSERLDKLHARMSQLDYTPTPIRALMGTESDECSRLSEVPFTGSETFETNDREENLMGSRPECRWAGRGIKEDPFEIIETEISLSDLFSDPGTTAMSFLHENGDGIPNYEGDPYGFPSDILTMASIIPHPVGASSAIFEI